MSHPRDDKIRANLAATGGVVPWLRAVVATACMIAALMVAALPFAAPAVAQSTEKARPFTICKDQDYALCAAAKCTMYNGVAYCKCNTEHGDSISLTLPTKKGDVCAFNAAGVDNGYEVSTFSLPKEVVKPGGDKAIYTCEADTADGTYAQCDGGICFESTVREEFPGLGRVTRKEIVCSCPSVTADPSTAKTGYQILGPYPCEQSFFKYCGSKTANTDNGASIYVGAPTGSARFLTRMLTGSVPRLNHCVRAPS